MHRSRVGSLLRASSVPPKMSTYFNAPYQHFLNRNFYRLVVQSSATLTYRPHLEFNSTNSPLLTTLHILQNLIEGSVQKRAPEIFTNFLYVLRSGSTPIHHRNHCCSPTLEGLHSRQQSSREPSVCGSRSNYITTFKWGPYIQGHALR